MKTLLISVCFFAVFGCQTAPPNPDPNPNPGGGFHVDMNGVDGDNSGRIDAPFRTLGYAFAVAGAGDTIYVHAGRYEMNEVRVRRALGQGGAPGNPLQVRAWGGKVVFGYSSRRLILDADYVEFYNLDFEMPWRVDAFGDGIKFVGNTFSGRQPRFGAVQCGGNGIEIIGNTFKFTAGGNGKDHAIYLKRGIGLMSKNILISGNIIDGSTGYGIHIFDQASSQRPGGGSIENVRISGNIIANSRTKRGVVLQGQDGVAILNVMIDNNRIVGNAFGGVLVRTGQGITLRDNCFSGPRPWVDDLAGAVTETGTTQCK